MTTATRPARHRIGITVVTGRERLLALCRELPRDPVTGKRRRFDKSDRIRSKAREKFEDALAEYRRTGKIKTCKSPLLRDRLGRWFNGYKRPMVKTRVYETCRSDCRNIIAVICSVQLEDLVPWRVREMGNKIMRDRSSKTALNAYIRLRSALADAHVAGRAFRPHLVRAGDLKRRPQHHGHARAAAVPGGLDHPRLLAAG